MNLGPLLVLKSVIYSCFKAFELFVNEICFTSVSLHEQGDTQAPSKKQGQGQCLSWSLQWPGTEGNQRPPQGLGSASLTGKGQINRIGLALYYSLH